MKRYTNWCLVTHHHDLLESDTGAWVLHDEAAARIAELEADRDAYSRTIRRQAEDYAATLDELRTELAQLREGIALRAKGQVGPDALVEELRTELAAARVNPDDIARIMRTHSTNDKDECIRILALRVDRLISQLPPAREDNPFNYREW